MLGGVEVDGVLVAAEDVDRVRAGSETRAGEEAGIDGVADGGVGRAGAFGAHVAFGGEAGEEVLLRRIHGNQGSLRDGFFDGLEVFGADVQEEMDVGVDEAGAKGLVAEIDDLRAGGDGGVDGEDAVALDEDDGGGDEGAGGDVEHVRGAEGGDRRGGALGEEGRGCDDSEDEVLQHGDSFRVGSRPGPPPRGEGPKVFKRLGLSTKVQTR